MRHEDNLAYNSWKAMKQRCQYQGAHGFSAYGGRGIFVCDRWQSFGLFLKDMGERPSKEHQLDRINRDDGYHKDNCRWVTRLQNLKRRKFGPHRGYHRKTKKPKELVLT